MSVPVIAFVPPRQGTGCTSIVYHVAWMLAELGLPVLAADLDPQANLTAAFLDDDNLADLWGDQDAGAEAPRRTIHGAVSPLVAGIGDAAAAPTVAVGERLWLVPGDMDLARFEDQLSEVWPTCLDRENERPLRVMSALWRALQQGAAARGAAVILVDLGPNLGAINRAALIAADHVVVPVSPDLFSLQGLRNLGPAVREWREAWAMRRARNPRPSLPLPEGRIAAAGYVVLRHAIRLDRPVKAFERWIARIPQAYARHVLGREPTAGVSPLDDPQCLARLKDYRSLAPLAHDARCPIFALRPADGALGAHMQAVQAAHREFHDLAVALARRTGLPLPT